MGKIFADKIGTDAGEIDNDAEKKKNKKRIVFAVIGIIIVSIVIGAYVYEKYGYVTLSPGEHYTVNIPFIGASNNPTIEGYAKYTNGTPIKDINVTVKYKGNDTVLKWNLTDKNGYYKIILPEIKENKQYDVYVGYDNSTNTTNLTLASHDYALNLYAEKDIYNKSTDTVVIMTGTIDNENARIEKGRMDVNLKYKGNESGWSSAKEIFDYKRYYINAEPQENYAIPNDEVNITWQIPSDASIGEYKFYVKASFNAKEKTTNVYFNITE